MWLEHPEGRIAVQELTDDRRRVSVAETAPGLFVSRRECVSTYPVPLIQRILDVKGPGYLCDEIMRAEDADYVATFLRYALLGFVSPESFRGARVLDFGSGSGASTLVLTRMFPDAQIVGVELEPDFIEIARMRAAHYGFVNLDFLQSPSPEEMPAGIGTFRYINLGAVYEHLLPDERRRLIPQLWRLLDRAGVLFVNQLPYRFYPVEQHTTGLPLLNYLPPGLARRAATRLSSRIGADATWPDLLRAGIRGGTEREVRRDIERGGGVPESLTPDKLGLRSHTDLWYAYSQRHRPHPVKGVMRHVFGGIHTVTRANFLPGLSLAFRKGG
jgi:SAM-dependent methyltransferase